MPPAHKRVHVLLTETVRTPAQHLPVKETVRPLRFGAIEEAVLTKPFLPFAHNQA